MSLKIPKIRVLLIIAFFAFLEPSSMSSFLPGLHRILLVVKGVMLIMATLKIMGSKMYNNSCFIILMSYHLILGIATFTHGGVIHTWLYSMYNQMGMVAFILLAVIKYEEEEETLHSFLFVVTLYLCLNALLGIRNSTYLLGFRTAIPRFALPAMGLVISYKDYYKKFIDKILIIALITFGLYYVFSESVATGIAQIAVWIIVYGAYRIWPKLKDKNMVFTIALVILNFAVVVFNATNALAWVVQTLLKRDMTFTGRTYIWSTAVKRFLQSPIIGNGVGTSEYALGMNYAHTQFLNVLCNGGIIACGLLLLLIFLAQKNLQRGNNSTRNLTLSVTILALLVGSSTEAVFDNTNAIIVLVFAIIDSHNRSEQEYVDGGRGKYVSEDYR